MAMNTKYIQMNEYVYFYVNNPREDGFYPTSHFSKGNFSTQKYGALEALRRLTATFNSTYSYSGVVPAVAGTKPYANTKIEVVTQAFSGDVLVRLYLKTRVYAVHLMMRGEVHVDAHVSCNNHMPSYGVAQNVVKTVLATIEYHADNGFSDWTKTQENPITIMHQVAGNSALPDVRSRFGASLAPKLLNANAFITLGQSFANKGRASWLISEELAFQLSFGKLMSDVDYRLSLQKFIAESETLYLYSAPEDTRSTSSLVRILPDSVLKCAADFDRNNVPRMLLNRKDDHLHVAWREDVNTNVTADDLESVVGDYAVLAETKGAEYAGFFDELRRHTTTTQFVVIGSKELIAAALTFGSIPTERTMLITTDGDGCEKFRRRYHDFQVITDNVEGKHLGDINVREQSACEWLTSSFKAG